MTDTITIRPTTTDKERIRFINKNTPHKTATAAVQVALQAYDDAVQQRIDSDASRAMVDHEDL